MELTTEQRARIFALYLGCEATLTGDRYHEGPPPVIASALCRDGIGLSANGLDGRMRSWEVPFEETQLILRSVSAITDDETVMVGLLSGYVLRTDANESIGWSRESLIERIWEAFLSFDSIYSDGEERKIDMLSSAAFQYLTQQGVSLPLFIAPSHPYNGKTAIDLGLAIDSTK